MKKDIRISDCLDDIDETEIDTVRPKMKSRFGVSNKNIKSLAIEKMGMDAKKSSLKSSRKPLRVVLAVVIVATVLASTA